MALLAESAHVRDQRAALLAGPAKTSPELVARLNRDFAEVMNTDEVKTELARQGLLVRTGTPEQLDALIRSDIARWQKVVDTAGIKAD
ncbi:hypothetical protein JI739_16325 [Ramlibacter sp. AW1]|uniref:Tripartite tricarboxylate transporter substrate binding protein n=1 Tax=Ramlibacter aurantiacus TaxID=2801330 RepID=A0A936ZJ86_9BURK|nr:tripartite tricarboxylate transporter substrate-binding protein [Ramlibacter aurantiacus]MBL0421917.1 hypothetical protein [Ramlibacter aurantiacus]